MQNCDSPLLWDHICKRLYPAEVEVLERLISLSIIQRNREKKRTVDGLIYLLSAVEDKNSELIKITNRLKYSSQALNATFDAKSTTSSTLDEGSCIGVCVSMPPTCVSRTSTATSGCLSRPITAYEENAMRAQERVLGRLDTHTHTHTPRGE
eukprot:GHVR01128837.1.p1 GENE.GHVR01128837.1~~GHVR01128837.1.p1  ORF type:complete len:152 (-),score=40.00 GHVR01128837.1:337-792(-)